MLETLVQAPLLIREQSGDRDNQQERPRGWLAGIVDGEGSLSITHKRVNGKLFYYPEIVIVNTNPLIVDKALQVIKPITGVYVQLVKRSRVLPVWRLRIMGFERVRKFLQVMTPYLEGKREQALILQKFIETQGDNENQYREQLKEELEHARNPQRLYAQQFIELKIKSDLTGDSKLTTVSK